MGAPGHDVNGISKCGGIFIFRKNSNGWDRHQILHAPDLSGGDRLGRAVAASRDDTIFASAWYANQNIGKIYSFQRVENSTWVFKEMIIPEVLHLFK